MHIVALLIASRDQLVIDKSNSVVQIRGWYECTGTEKLEARVMASVRHVENTASAA
jgi:uncharacterized membrane protein SirB2